MMRCFSGAEADLHFSGGVAHFSGGVVHFLGGVVGRIIFDLLGTISFGEPWADGVRGLDAFDSKPGPNLPDGDYYQQRRSH